MTLPLPQLDNQTFDQLMEEARKLIPRYAPNWTDYNTHDPGITFIELFAWLTELQRYYLDQVRDENYLKFLKLLGFGLKDANPATADVTFSFVDRQMLTPVLVPRGTKLATRERVIFETDSSVPLVPASLEKIISSSGRGRRDNLEAERTRGLSFYAFGENAEVGSCLYLGFAPLFLFDWDKVPSCEENADTERLKQYLDQYLGISWVKNVDDQGIIKINNGRTIVIADGDRELTLNLNDANDRVELASTPEIRDRVYFYAFREDNQLSIYAQPFPARKTIPLTFNLFEDYPVAPGRYLEKSVKFTPSVALTWEYYSTAGYWQNLEIEEDETQMLYQSGRVWFNSPIDMKVRNIFPFYKPLYWLRVTVKQAGYELPPQLISILVNTISVAQTDTLVETISHFSNRERIQFFPASYLAFKGENIVQVRTPEGYWQDEFGYDLQKIIDWEFIKIVFQEEITPLVEKCANIRIISSVSGSNNLQNLFKSTGLPNQVFDLKRSPVIVQTFQLQVRETINDSICWCDWIRVDNFDASRPEDRHYVLEPQHGKIHFGDGVNGYIPPVSDRENEENIRIISCQIVKGEAGNVEAKAIGEIYEPASGLLDPDFVTVENRQAASGGTVRETLEQGKRRARTQLKQIDRAVTSEDFEQLALATPGLRVARAKAFLPQGCELGSRVKVVIVPYSETQKPTQPSSGFLQAVSCHLDRHRLIGTQIEVLVPQFVEVAVKVAVRIWPEFDPDESRREIETFLVRDFLNPLTGGWEGKGWPFGRTVYQSEVYRAIENSTEAVDCVEDLQLLAGDAPEDIRVDRDGNIPISPGSLIYSTKHQIEIRTGEELR